MSWDDICDSHRKPRSSIATTASWVIRHQWQHQKFSFGGYGPGSGKRKSSSKVQGEALVRVEAETVCRRWLQILTAETIKIRKIRTIYLLILDQYMFYDGRG